MKYNREQIVDNTLLQGGYYFIEYGSRKISLRDRNHNIIIDRVPRRDLNAFLHNEYWDKIIRESYHGYAISTSLEEEYYDIR